MQKTGRRNIGGWKDFYIRIVYNLPGHADLGGQWQGGDLYWSGIHHMEGEIGTPQIIHQTQTQATSQVTKRD